MLLRLYTYIVVASYDELDKRLDSLIRFILDLNVLNYGPPSPHDLQLLLLLLSVLLVRLEFRWGYTVH